MEAWKQLPNGGRFLLLLLACFAHLGHPILAWRPCPELSPALRLPCRCNVVPFAATGQLGAVAMDCDRVVFHGDAPQLPYGAPIVAYTQRHSGQQVLPAQTFGQLKLTIEELDLSYNLIRRIPEKAFDGLKDSLNELRLANNLLGDNLNPIFSTAELHVLKNLRILDLSGNKIKLIEEGLLKGCVDLKEFYIDRNSLTSVPTNSLNGPSALRHLSLRQNQIGSLLADSFNAQRQLEIIDLRHNVIRSIDSLAFKGLQKIREIKLAGNRISHLNSDVFEKLQSLQKLDLSENFFAVINADTFAGLESTLMALKLSQNRLTGLGGAPWVLPELRSLDLSGNTLTELPSTIFEELENLQSLNLSGNHLTPLTGALFKPLDRLQVIDLSRCNIRQISGDLLAGLQDLKHIYLNDNQLQELQDGSFVNLWNISSIDLSHNRIGSIRSGAFVNVMKLQKLDLHGNQLSAFKGEYFNTGTGIEELDISDNQLSYLFPSSFRIHPRLREIRAANNKFSFFPAELISTLQYLEHIDLSHNQLKTIEELDFARLPRLRVLLVANNQLDMVSEMAFHNSTQLQILDLANNNLDRIGERTFEGLVRLEQLNLEGNRLSELSDGVFERTKLQMLENINLAHNRFEYAPLNALQRQFFFVSSVDLSHNKIKELPGDDSIMVNIKRIDLSFNPLSSKAVHNVLNEPKTVRELSLAGTGIENLELLETPFLQFLNLSHNKLKNVKPEVFQRVTLLETLDLSSNQLESLEDLSMAWPQLQVLQSLDVSNNSFEIVSQSNFGKLEMLRSLRLSHLPQCTRIEKNAFKQLPNLVSLEAYDLPLLGYLDLQGILELLPGLEVLDIEVKDSSIGSEQIQPLKHPRLKSLGIRGERLKSISSGTLAGLKSNDLIVQLRNTSLNALPPALLFPVPRSSHLSLNVEGSKITVLVPQFLNALEDRRASLQLQGLASNPIVCDCNARALRRWLPSSGMPDVTCASPAYLLNRKLIEVGDDELTCDARRMTSSTSRPTSSVPHLLKTSSQLVTRSSSTTEEPLIIWSLEPTQPPSLKKMKTKAPLMKAQSPIISNDDTLIIGIVGGVVAFIAILIIIICIIRLRMSNAEYQQNATMIGIPAGMQMGAHNAAYNYKNGAGAALYAVPPYHATLPHKAASIHQSSQNLSQRQQQQQQQQQQQVAAAAAAYSTMSRMSYFSGAGGGNGDGAESLTHQHPHQHQPYIIYSDDKAYR
ncbi:GM12844 [Drosophila sechellia]|uniref:GM12844 n=1 Tax=Drosophila sechellia TaxID=7238 RepID=B4HZI8_DROSE|nr:GM12844 [Drosophila sechellia]